MEVTVSIGCDVTVIITDDQGWSPDQLDDACRRAGTEALRVHQELAGDASA